MKNLRGVHLGQADVDPTMLTPAGIALQLLQPPFIYIIAGIVVVVLIGLLVRTFWETFEPCILGTLDTLAAIFRGIQAVFQGLFWMAKRCVYPVKENLLNSIDSVDQTLHPYKAKKPFSGVSTFQVK
eukprot:TRINITY_DN77113_c0_g1_i1.p2 TRINITY_DN77113_c0_g1~~TRINITY_DN77113_c0_g1_i1.p2  ORF type:complete len:127 (-),score=28.44 TRINITY_DN77113_c0_g1_i1:93-473(-)